MMHNIFKQDKELVASTNDDDDRHGDTKPTYDQDNPPPTKVPSSYPTKSPSKSPSLKPSASPSSRPSNYPSISPSLFPSKTPSTFPSLLPTETPSLSPSLTPSTSPSLIPSGSPSISPSSDPSNSPSAFPSGYPSLVPSKLPSSLPSITPSRSPSHFPSSFPSSIPSINPSSLPTSKPSKEPTKIPSVQPSKSPSLRPSKQPTSFPSKKPSHTPTLIPSSTPSSSPSNKPSVSPSSHPFFSPSHIPSISPSFTPTSLPSTQPSSSPSIEPSLSPSLNPSSSPSTIPSSSPSTMPSKYTCKLSGDGNFGNTSGVNIQREIMAFSFDAILNMTLLNATSGSDEQKVNQAVVPSIESQLSDLLLPSIFPQCNGAVGDSTSSLSRVKGMSSQPKDRVSERKCITQDSSGGDCFPIDGGLSLYYESSERRYMSRELVEDNGIQSTIDFIEESIKTLMDKGDMNNAHPAIIKISYVETNNNPIIPPIEKPDNGNSVSTNIVWWQIGLGIGVAGLLVGGIVLILFRRKKSTDSVSHDESSFD